MASIATMIVFIDINALTIYPYRVYSDLGRSDSGFNR